MNSIDVVIAFYFITDTQLHNYKQGFTFRLAGCEPRYLN